MFIGVKKRDTLNLTTIEDLPCHVVTNKLIKTEQIGVLKAKKKYARID